MSLTQESGHSKNNVQHMIPKKIRVKGMTCNHCRQNVENGIKNIEGIERVNVDLSTGLVTISGKTIDLSIIQSTIEDLGYEYRGETDS